MKLPDEETAGDEVGVVAANRHFERGAQTKSPEVAGVASGNTEGMIQNGDEEEADEKKEALLKQYTEIFSVFDTHEGYRGSCARSVVDHFPPHNVNPSASAT